jgi:Domain of unknown function (DUF2760)
MSRPARIGLSFLLATVLAAAVAAGNWYLMSPLLGPPPFACVPCVACLLGAPFALAYLLALLLPRGGTAAAAPAAVEAPEPPPDTSHEGALRLLAVLQEGGRLVDFFEEDLSPYPDDQIGAAIRGIHEGCRKALHERVTLEPILAGAEGETVTVEAGFDPAAVRLSGNVAGEPPFRGVLRHAGWRATQASVPARKGQDPHVIAPAEVEIA